MTSPVDVVNLALSEIGTQGTVSSINPSDGSAEGNAASLLYEPKIKALMRSANWGFCRKQLTLTLLRAAVIDGAVSSDPPPQPWLFEYAYPSDCLRAQYVVPIVQNDGISPPLTTGTVLANPWQSSGAVKFQISSAEDADGNIIKVILTNQENAVLVYTRYIENPDLWDPSFLSAATATLGAFFVPALSMNRDLMQLQIKVAADIITQARVSDGDEGLTMQDHTPDWIRIRGFGPSLYGPTAPFANWDAMLFPGGYLV